MSIWAMKLPEKVISSEDAELEPMVKDIIWTGVIWSDLTRGMC